LKIFKISCGSINPGFLLHCRNGKVMKKSPVA
jgi:hypothetical protein